MIVTGTNVTSSTTVSDYIDTTVLYADTENETTIANNYVPALDNNNQTPTISKGVVTVQPGNIVFNNQQILALAGDTIKIGGYGKSLINDVFGYTVEITDLELTLTAPTTTTSGAVSNSTSIGVADREGVINNVSRISGIGINPALQDPLITAGGGADGAGNFTADAAQTLESGITLTIQNTGRIATITGNIEITKVGNTDATFRFDVDKLLSTSAS